MRERVRRRRSAKKRTVRWIAAAVVLCSAMSCVAPVLYASDCSRWIAEYKQGILQRRAARRLRAAKYRLTALVHPAQTTPHHPKRRPMGPLEALRRFQIDCGDVETPEMAPRLPSVPVIPTPLLAQFPEVPPPDLGFPAPAEVAENVPPLQQVPTSVIPIETVPTPSPVPEPASLALLATGAAASALLVRRRNALLKSA
jgi:hypothetical protein